MQQEEQPVAGKKPSISARFQLQGLRKKSHSSKTPAPLKPVVSRRTFLALSGAIATNAIPTAFRDGDFSVTHSGGIIEVLTGSVVRWTIDPKTFGPRARTHVQRSHDSLVLRLSDAVFPATDLPADMRCLLVRTAGLWTMRLTNALGMDLSGPWLKWLEGADSATGNWNSACLRPIPTVALAVQFSGRVRFKPDWSFAAESARVKLDRLPSPLECGSVQWRVCTSGQLGAGTQELPATMFRFTRGASSWGLPLRREHSDGWKLDHDDELEFFDELTVEAGSTIGGTLHTAMLSGSGEAQLRLLPAPGLRTIDDAQFHIALTRPRIVFSLGEAEAQSVLLADALNEESWAHTETVSLQFGAPATSDAFELHSACDASTVVTAPSLTAVHVPAPDTSIRLTFKHGKKPFFQWSHFVQQIERVLGILGTPPWEHPLVFDLTCGDVLTVVRPADMLKLEFEFQDMVLHTGLSPHIKPAHGSAASGTISAPGVGDNDLPSGPLPAPSLHCKPRGAPRVTVTFPPQHIQEKAFFHNDDAFSTKLHAGLGTVEINRLNGQPESHTPTPSEVNDAYKRANEIVEANATDKLDDINPPQLAGTSHLVFDLTGVKSIPFRLEDLLNWQSWKLVVDPVAKTTALPVAPGAAVDNAKNPPLPDHAPAKNEATAIELPYRLFLSPSEKGQWAHSPKAVSYGDNVELWHTRLAVATKGAPDEQNASDRIVRAIFTPDRSPDRKVKLPAHESGQPLDARDRAELVYLTSDYQNQAIFNVCPSQPHPTPYTPLPVSVDHLMLTSQGGYLKSIGNWNPPLLSSGSILTVEQWRHVATVGRDQYVRVVYKGYLAPFAHRASLVKISERVIVQASGTGVSGNKNWFALLHERMYIVIHEPRRDFPLFSQPNAGRDFPFRRVDVLTTTTPDLDDPTVQVVKWSNAPTQTQSLFWPCVDKQPFLFRFRFWDVEGNVSEASMPVVFGDAQQAQTHDGVAALVALFNGGKNGKTVKQDVATARTDPWTSIPLGNQSVAFAPSSQPGDTRYEAGTMLWQIQDQSTGVPNHDLCFYERDLPLFAPQIGQAKISSTAVNRVTGSSNGTWVKFFEPYVSTGFDAKKNAGEVVLQVDEANGPPLQFGAARKTDQSGGFTSPDTKVVGFSRKSGPVGGTSTSASLTTWSSGKFDPPDFFGAFSTAKILGAVKLSDIIAPLLGGVASNLEKAPQMLQQSLYKIEKALTDFENGAVTAIRHFQDTLPTSGGSNPLTRRLAPEAQTVYANQATLEKMQSNSPDLFTEAVALPYHAKLIRSIIDYGQALDTAVNDPPALASGLVDDAIAQLEPAIAAVQAEVESAIETFAAQLVIALAGPVQAAIDKFLQPLAEKLVNLSVSDPLLVSGDDLRPDEVAMQDLLPELMAVEAMLPIARRLQGNVQQLSTNLHGSAGPADLATVVEQTSDICQDLQQLLQAAGPLGVAAQLDNVNWASLQTALLEIQTKLLTLWDQAQGALALKAQLSAVEQGCMTLAYEMTDVTINQLNADGAQLMQNLRQLERTAAMIDGCRTAWNSLQNANKQTNASKLRYLQRLQQLQRQAIDSIRAIQRIAADLLNAAGNATPAAVLAASNLLADVWLGSDLFVQEITCIKGLLTQVVGDLLKDTEGGITLETFQPIVSQQLDSLLASVKTAQTEATNHAKNISGNQPAVTAAHAALQSAIQSGTNIDAKKAALLIAWQPAITEVNAYLDSATAVYDQVIQYVHCAQLVVSWWVYTGYPALQEFASRENLKNLALGFAGTACQTQLPGQNTSMCGLAVSTLNSVLTSSKKLASALAQAPPPLPVLFGGATNSIGGISPLTVDATPSQILTQAHGMITTYSQCVADVRKRTTGALKDAESLLQARNLVPFLLANLPIPHTLSLNYDWNPQIKSFEPVFLLDSGADLKISVRSQIDLTGSNAPTYDITARLTKFAINLIGTPSFVIVRVDSLNFTSSNGNKPDIRLHINKVEFGKDLSFVQALAEALNPKTGPFMEFVGNGIRAGFRFHLPNVPMGGFLLMQLAIEVAVSLSFDGSPVRCQFGLSDQQNPFLLSAGIYGGGGFLQLQLGLDGVQVLEGALEFGLVAGISIGPLSGSGYVVAGIYMRIAKTDSVVAGFVHAHGHMDIFGIVSMDVDLMVTVRYQEGNVSGSAVFTVSVHILFFSADFTMEASYGFQGSGADEDRSALKRGDSRELAQVTDEPWMSDEAWTEYYEAFAA